MRIENGDRIGPATLARLRLASGHRAPLITPRDAYRRFLDRMIAGILCLIGLCVWWLR